MKKRTKGMLADNKLSHEGEIFDYIRELHEYLWRFVRTVIPGASGNLPEWLDKAIYKAESEGKE